MLFLSFVDIPEADKANRDRKAKAGNDLRDAPKVHLNHSLHDNYTIAIAKCQEL